MASPTDAFPYLPPIPSQFLVNDSPVEVDEGPQEPLTDSEKRDRLIEQHLPFTSIAVVLALGGAWPFACLLVPFIPLDLKWWFQWRRARATAEQASESLWSGSWHWFNRKSARSVFPAPDDTIADWSFFGRPSINPSECFFSARQAFSEAESIAWRYGHDMPSAWGDE